MAARVLTPWPAQTTLDTLITLEDAFIAAYLVGVRDFSTADLRVTAARIMGIESDHRTLGRVLAGDVPSTDGGPIKAITGVQGKAETADPPNNNGYERTLEWASSTHSSDELAHTGPRGCRFASAPAPGALAAARVHHARPVLARESEDGYRSRRSRSLSSSPRVNSSSSSLPWRSVHATIARQAANASPSRPSLSSRYALLKSGLIP
ncbi:MAG TPA: hypothetical protein VKS25_10410 [Solirubrobacteraceae bacterium]|nr:hypothetical protein [Solirubrobacteraceae bacterium]